MSQSKGIVGWQAKSKDFLLVRGDDKKFMIGRVLHMTKTHYYLQWWVREHHSASPLRAAYLPQKNHVGCPREKLEQLPCDEQCIQDVVKMVRATGGEGRMCLSSQGMSRATYWENQWRKQKNAHDSDSDDDTSLAELGRRFRHAQEGRADADSHMEPGLMEMRVFDYTGPHHPVARCKIMTWGCQGKGTSVTLKLKKGEYVETFADIKDKKLLSYTICVRGGQGADGSK
jgi:hypothetical protein